MLIFFFAQTHAGLLRMSMLSINFSMAAYVCSSFYQNKKKLLLSVMSAIYIGILLPCLAIGNNQYTCFNVGRSGYYSLDTYPGIFSIEDKETGKIGLRSRYGLLVKPEYDAFVYHTSRHWFGELELRKNGYYTLYDICNNEYRKDNHISVYNIHVTLARENMPKPKEAEMLVQKISCFLKKVDIISTTLPLSYNER